MRYKKNLSKKKSFMADTMESGVDQDTAIRDVQGEIIRLANSSPLYKEREQYILN